MPMEEKEKIPDSRKSETNETRLVALRLAYTAIMGAIAFALVFILEPLIRLVLDPTMARFVIAVISAMVISIGCKGVEKFPYAAVVWIVYSLLATFTPTMGPPGPHKPLIGLSIGLVVEGGFLVFGRKGWSYFLAGGVMCGTTPLFIVGSLRLFGLNEQFVNQVIAKLWVLLPLNFIFGGLGMYLGNLVFDHFINKANFIIRLRGSSQR